MKKISKKELLSAREKAERLKTAILPCAVGVSMALAPVGVVASMAVLTGCGYDKDKPKKDKTAIVINDNHALLVEIQYCDSTPVGKSDKVEYSLHLRHDEFAYITVYDDTDTDVIIVDDVNSLERAKEIAYASIGEDAVIEVYGADTKTLTYSND